MLQCVQRAERIDAGVLVLADQDDGDHHGRDSCQEHVELGGLVEALVSVLNRSCRPTVPPPTPTAFSVLLPTP